MTMNVNNGEIRHLGAKEILLKAAELVSETRHQTHGDKVKNLDNIAHMWNAYLRIRKDYTFPLDGQDVCHMMSLLKIVRTQGGNYNEDDYIDGAGYSAMAGEVAPK